MNTTEARKLRVGDAVEAYNGPYTQKGFVTAIEPHHRSGFWVTFRWIDTRGKEQWTKKRHSSVHMIPTYRCT